MSNPATEKQILEQLITICTSLIKERALPDVLDTILNGIHSIGFTRVRLYLLSDDKEFMQGTAHIGMEEMDEPFTKFNMAVKDDPLLQQLNINSQPSLMERRNGKEFIYDEELKRQDVDEWVYLPLIWQSEVMGLIVADNKGSKAKISLESLPPLALFATHISVAINQARHLDEFKASQTLMSRRMKNRTALQEVHLAINSETDLQEIFEITCRSLVELFGVDHCGLVQFDANYNEGQVVAEFPNLGAYGHSFLIKGIPAEENMIATQLPFMTKDVKEYEALGSIRNNILGFNIVSILIVPIILNGRVWGSFSLDVNHHYLFTKEEVTLCQLFADHLATAIHNSLIIVEATKRAELLSVLSKLTLNITSKLDRSTLFDEIISSAIQLIGAQGGGIKEYHPDQGYLETIADISQDISLVGHIVNEGTGIAGRLVLTEQKYLAIEDYSSWDGKIDGVAFGSIIGFKLSWQSYTIGVLYIEDKKGRKFTEGEIEILQLFADHAAITLINANLLQQKNEQKARFEQLVRSSPHGIIANNSQGQITAFNQQASNILKYSPAEIINQPVTDIFVNSKDAKMIGRLIRQNEQTIDYETTLLSKTGEHVPVRLTATRTGQEWDNTAYLGYFEDLRVRQVGERLDLVLRVGRLLAGAENVHDGLQKLAQMLVTFWGSSFCRVFLLDEAGKNLKIAAACLRDDMAREVYWEPQMGMKTAVSEWHRLDELLLESPSSIIKSSGTHARQILAAWKEKHSLNHEIHSLLAVPLRTRDNRVVGLLDLGEILPWETASFTEEQKQLMEAIAQHAAVLIDRFNAYEVTKQMEARLRNAFEASNKLVLSNNPEKAWPDIMKQAQQVAKGDGVRVILIDPILKVGTDIFTTESLDLQVSSLVRKDGLSMKVMQNGTPEFVMDASAEPDRVNPSFFTRGIQSAVGLPVAIEGNRIGVMWIYYKSPQQFSQGKLDSLQLFVNQAALAYDGMVRIETLDKLREAVAAMAGSETVLGTLNKIIDQAREVLEADSAVIWAYDDTRNQFILGDSVATGILPETWQSFQEAEPRLGGSVEHVMREGWVSVPNILSNDDYSFLGKETRRRLSDINIRSFQGITLGVGDEKLGILYVNYNRVRHFNNEEQKTARMFARHAALALKKAKLSEHNQKMQFAAKLVSKATNLEGKLKQKLEKIVKGVKNVLGCDAVTLYQYDSDKQVLISPSIHIGVRYPKRHMRETGIVREKSIVQFMLTQKDIYAADKVKDDELLSQTAFAIDEEIESCAAIPLRMGKETVGVMFINSRKPRDFTNDDFEILRLFANQTAVAIHNDHLFREQQKRANQLKALHAAAKSVTSSLALNDTLFAIVMQARKLMGKRGSQAQFSHLALVRGSRLSFQAAYPRRNLALLKKKLGIINLETDDIVGVTGEAALSKKSVLVRDVTNKKNYIEFDERIRSTLSVPLISEQRVIGVITVVHTQVNGFDQQDVIALETLAEYAAIAIQNAQLYEWLETIARISSEAANNLDTTRLLRTVCQRLEQEVRRSISASIRLYDEAKNILIFDPSWHESLSNRMDMGDSEGRKSQQLNQGICGWVATNKKSLIMGDVTSPHADPKPLRLLSKTRSELCVPILYGEDKKLMGVLDIQSPEYNAFYENDRVFLEILADQLAIAIHKAHDIKIVTARTGLAWMGMASNAWQHSLAGDALAIDTTVGSLRRQINKLTYDESILKSVETKLKRVENLASKMLDRPITPSLTQGDSEMVIINRLIHDKKTQLWRNQPYKDINSVKLNLVSTEDIAVRASPQWLQQVLELLINNAVRAMVDSRYSRLSISTYIENERVKVFISDNGCGISDEVLARLFTERISNSDGGMGIGLLMAELIVQMFGGNIWLEETSSEGTTFAFSLPVIKT